jgi:hypothetical protein
MIQCHFFNYESHMKSPGIELGPQKYEYSGLLPELWHGNEQVKMVILKWDVKEI